MKTFLTALAAIGAAIAGLAQTGTVEQWKPIPPFAEEVSFVAPSATTRISDTPRVLIADIRDEKRFKRVVSPHIVIDNPYLDPADPFFNIPRSMTCTPDNGLVVASTAKTSPSGRFQGNPYASGFWRVAADGAVTALTAKHIVVENSALPVCDVSFAKSRITPEIGPMTLTADGGLLFAAHPGLGVFLKLTRAGRVELVPPSPQGCAPPGLSREARTQFVHPTAVVEDPRGAIWMADECRLTRRDPDGTMHTVLDKQAACPIGDPEHRVMMDIMLWDHAKDELVTSGRFYALLPKENDYATVWRIGRDDKPRRVFLGVRLGTTPAATRLVGINGLALDAQGRIHMGVGFAEESGSQIRRLNEATGATTTVAGISLDTNASYVDGAVRQASFGNIVGMCFAPNGNLFVHEASHVIRKVTPAGQVTTWVF
jgi:hypothetical protein